EERPGGSLPVNPNDPDGPWAWSPKGTTSITNINLIQGGFIPMADLSFGRQNPGQSQQFTLSDCRVRAMLDTIAWSEGTSADADGGYGRVVKGTVTNSKHNPPNLIGQQNVTITDFSHHPDLRVQTPYGASS